MNYVQHYERPEPSLTGFPKVPSQLANDKSAMMRVLMEHMTEFDAIVTAGDFHGVALASIAAAWLWKPLLVICHGSTHEDTDHSCSVSHMVMFGEIHPEMRFLYLDDMFTFGKSWKHVRDYMNQSEDAPIVARYEHLKREYSLVGEIDDDTSEY